MIRGMKPWNYVSSKGLIVDTRGRQIEMTSFTEKGDHPSSFSAPCNRSVSWDFYHVRRLSKSLPRSSGFGKLHLTAACLQEEVRRRQRRTQRKKMPHIKNYVARWRWNTSKELLLVLQKKPLKKMKVIWKRKRLTALLCGMLLLALMMHWQPSMS